MGLKARLRARPQPLSVINRFNRHNPKMDWHKAQQELRRKHREWEPPSPTWWLEGPRKPSAAKQARGAGVKQGEGDVVAAGSL